jgi:peptidoglycan hydrolase CwlO-like protein
MRSKKKKEKRAVEKPSSKQRDLEKSLSNLRGQLTRTERALTKAKDRADRWRKEAKAQKRSASRARARVEKLHQKMDGASAALKPVQAAAPLDVVASSRPVAEPTTVDGVTAPDETWSVVQLRAEARARGLTGMSNKTKAQLLTALS